MKIHFFYKSEIEEYEVKFGYNFTQCLIRHDPGVSIEHVSDIIAEYGHVISKDHWRWLVRLDNGCFALISAYCASGDWEVYAPTYAIVHQSMLQCVFSEENEKALSSLLYQILSEDPEWKVENDDAFQDWRRSLYKTQA